jgi:SAM-dependent methyltransferase
MPTTHQASEQVTLDEALRRLPQAEAHVGKILARLRKVASLPAGAEVLDIGAAQGQVLIACLRRGLRATGVEPCGRAREVAARLAAREGVRIDIRAGVAEKLPLPSDSFDLVHANSVIEHVGDPQAMLDEAWRVLRGGGLLWFSGASSMCPRQREIAGFPCFGWYPDRLKRRIMAWAKARRPDLIGHTDTPAMHWLTPSRARGMLHAAGFARIYDRWDLRLEAEGGRLHAAALGFIRRCPLGELLADVLVPACSYAAVK